MAWFAVYETASGRLVSTGEVVASPLPAGLTALSLEAAPQPTQMWDAATLAFVARPPKIVSTLLAQFQAQPEFAGLNAAGRTAITTAFRRVMTTKLDIDADAWPVRG